MADPGRFERIRRRLGRGGDPEAADLDEAEGPAPEGSDQPATEETGPGPAPEGWEGPALGDLRGGRRDSITDRLHAIADRIAATRPSLDLGAGFAAAAGAIRRGASTLGGRFRSTADAAGSAARSGSAAVGRSWLELPLEVRQRIGAAAAFAGVVALVAFVLIPAAPCWAPGGERCPPADRAIELVPADAAAYIHANLGPDTDQSEAASELFARLPELAALGTSLLGVVADRGIDYGDDVQPWSGGELAVVVAAAGLGVERMLIFEVDDADGAKRFARRYLGKNASVSDVAGVEVEVDASGRAAAIVDGFLLLGPEQQVRRSIELSPVDSLAIDPQASAARDLLPDDRLADAYLSGAFAEAASSSGELGALNTFVNASASEGVAAAVSVSDSGVDLAVRSVQDEQRAAQAPDFFAALPLFEPQLIEQIGADALAYVGLGDPSTGAAELARQATDLSPDLFSGLTDFSRRLRREQGVDIERDLLRSLRGEAALVAGPTGVGPDAPQDLQPGVISSPGVPYLGFVATDVDTAKVAKQLAELQAPVAGAIDPVAGQVPVFETREIDGVQAQSLTVSPAVELTYATFDDELVIGTDPLAVERILAAGSELGRSITYERATEGFPDQVSIVVYLDFRDLLSLAERLFLAADPGYARLAGDLRTLEAAALAITRTRFLLATDARVTVAEAQQSPPVGAAPGADGG